MQEFVTLKSFGATSSKHLILRSCFPRPHVFEQWDHFEITHLRSVDKGTSIT